MAATKKAAGAKPDPAEEVRLRFLDISGEVEGKATPWDLPQPLPPPSPAPPGSGGTSSP